MNCTVKQRRAAWILLVGFLLAILVSLTFCAEEVNHDCTGADCTVCAQLKLCENILARRKRWFRAVHSDIRAAFCAGGFAVALLSAFADKNTDSTKGKAVGLRNACPYDS